MVFVGSKSFFIVLMHDNNNDNNINNNNFSIYLFMLVLYAESKWDRKKGYTKNLLYINLIGGK